MQRCNKYPPLLNKLPNTYIAAYNALAVGYVRVGAGRNHPYWFVRILNRRPILYIYLSQEARGRRFYCKGQVGRMLFHGIRTLDAGGAESVDQSDIHLVVRANAYKS